ncbi:hypothetical protein BD410DRAFT_845872 [Rickenella mellea]|uniref:Uncharacterized protein n=1 Tax=Rickenella mellea TaxID=50990 RepID=A0A4Y7PJ96_9AGAM|nr:hypothetical protein BD410DRAFT_845872 [Rickenella mellea]
MVSKRFVLPFHVSHHNKRAATCQTGGFYVSPTSGQVVNSSVPFNISWNTSCLNNTNAVDIYLYAPGAANSKLHVWETVNYALGSYQTDLKPKWWNATANVNLQLAIVASGTPAFLSPFPAAPVFAATYTAPPNGTAASANADTSHPDSFTQKVDNFIKRVSKGGIAAAVLVPIILIALAVFAYIRYTRMKETKKRQRWSQALDKRMSTISTDWKAMSAAGADAAIRNSMAITSRMSSASFTGSGRRPSTSMAVESGGHAGIGAGNNDNNDEEKMEQIRRPGVGPRGVSTISNGNGERVSRISFAADTRFSRTGDGASTNARPSGETAQSRPSLESRRAGAATRSFHMSTVPDVPPLPNSNKERVVSDGSRYDDESFDYRHEGGEEEEEGGAMSPTQKAGPIALSPDDIRARIAGQPNEVRTSLDEVMPALSMMRTGGGNASTNDLLLTVTPPEEDQLAHGQGHYQRGHDHYVQPMKTALTINTVPKSPIMESMPMMLPGAATTSMTSPDAMLRAYAEQRSAQSPQAMYYPPSSPNSNMNAYNMGLGSPGYPPPSYQSPTYPSPIATATTATRNLYSPNEKGVKVGTNNPFRESMHMAGVGAGGGAGGEEFDHEDAYMGMGTAK